MDISSNRSRIFGSVFNVQVLFVRFNIHLDVYSFIVETLEPLSLNLALILDAVRREIVLLDRPTGLIFCVLTDISTLRGSLYLIILFSPSRSGEALAVRISLKFAIFSKSIKFVISSGC